MPANEAREAVGRARGEQRLDVGRQAGSRLISGGRSTRVLRRRPLARAWRRRRACRCAPALGGARELAARRQAPKAWRPSCSTTCAAPAAYGDAHAWRTRLEALERDWIAPLADALRGGRIGMLTLHALGAGGSLRWRARARTCATSGVVRVPCPRGRTRLRARRLHDAHRHPPRPGACGRHAAAPGPASGARAPAMPRAACRIRAKLEYEFDPVCCRRRALLHRERGRGLPRRRHRRRQRLLIVADYDCDGATACAVGVRALRAFGARRGLSRAEPLRVRLRTHAARSSNSLRAAAPRCS